MEVEKENVSECWLAAYWCLDDFRSRLRDFDRNLGLGYQGGTTDEGGGVGTLTGGERGLRRLDLRTIAFSGCGFSI